MAKRVIVLAADARSVVAAFWAVVPAESRAYYANPAATSAWPGASAAEAQAIRDGVLYERVERHLADTKEDARRALEARWAEIQADVSATDPSANQGRYWDASGWHAPGT